MIKNTLAAGLLIGLLACQPTPPPQQEPFTTNSQEHLVASTLFTQQSAEYRALCYQAYHLAELRLLELKDSFPEKPAVVLDLDETVLDNSPYTAWQIESGNGYSKETWAQWVEKAEAEPIAGVSQFLHLADSLGVELYYVSNRDTSGLAATMKNMKALNLPQVEASHFLLKTTTSDKSARRKQITDSGAEILLFIGDNLGDFKHLFDDKTNAERKASIDELADQVGTQFIALPNALYGEWEGATYKYNWKLTDAQRDSARKASLVPTEL